VHCIEQDTSLELLPDNVWAVYALHGLDEGYRPVTPHHFSEMVSRARDLGWVIRTMKEMIIEFRCRRPSFNHWVERMEWSGQASADQERMMHYLRSDDLSGRTILHVGTGNSELGILCAATAKLVDTMSISPAEIDRANSLGLPNYRGFVCNKYFAERAAGRGRPQVRSDRRQQPRELRVLPPPLPRHDAGVSGNARAGWMDTGR
jgi:hypothetical protein